MEIHSQSGKGAGAQARRWLRRGAILATSILCGLLAGCSLDESPENPYVGNLNDFSYSGQITPERVLSRMSAAGRAVSIDQFHGRFVWADYAAPWCGPCVPQAQAIKSLESSYGEEIVFLTVMTSKSPGYRDLPDRQTAKAWSARFGLNPDRVVAANNLWGLTIPTHVLYSPKGQTLYRSTGSLSAQQIREILDRYRRDWNHWEHGGQLAAWMRFE